MPPITMTNYTTVLSIAGSDGSGGAGIQADLKTFAALGCYGLSVITDVTAQNTCGVFDSLALPSSFVKEQIEVLIDDITIDAIKIGMISSAATVRTVADTLRNLPSTPVILDTVLKSSDGTGLVSEEAKNTMIEELFPLATLVTPNLGEAARLSGTGSIPTTKSDIEKTAEMLKNKGTSAVLVKGGHMTGKHCNDYLLTAKGGEWFSSPKISSINNHGTGCTLSSAIAAYSAKGFGLAEAVKKGKQFTQEALQAGASFFLGNGAGPLHHLYRCWENPSPRGIRPIE
ncbi:bifunctional hydroxymethylpyrimidine kinase/phosphomethylpyrimidine kinase [Prosthecochloris sp.]|uniref:bifunctional hydroxymethylpyrimidine kinase/phosphomethylpyrimidine kinase n=1 Tax=Prosthecochloris sp. TaxID=290513 RepID=UPI0025ED24C4|nr:bifunctional hydroxymethylpyrimidine kinase/phosphomethylpyrimidine kinase [Prosthecochloris sp.]